MRAQPAFIAAALVLLAGGASAAAFDSAQSRAASGGLAAMSGYPHLTVPMGQVEGLPVGLSFIGPAWSDARMLAFGYAYEQKREPLPPPRLRDSNDEDSAGRSPRRP